VPTEFAWETPSTRCTIEEIRNMGSSSVHGSIGVSGGSRLSTGFGIGIGLGSPTGAELDYKIDCRPNK